MPTVVPARCRKRPDPLDRNDGVALILVLWVLVILTVIVGEFSAASRSQMQLAKNFMDSTQAHYLAASGVEQALYDMTTDRHFFTRFDPDRRETEEGRIRWRINGDNPPFQYGDGWFMVRIDDAAGRININRAGRPLLRMIMDGFDIDALQKDVIVDAIMDWRDEDHIHRLNGAEDDYYENIGAPHLCKDGDFDSVSELRFVRGITDELFAELEALFTVYPKSDRTPITEVSSTEDKDAFNWNRINVNAASPEVWSHLPGMSADHAQAIADYRRDRDLHSVGELASILDAGVYPRVQGYLTTLSSPWFVISAVGAVDGSAIVAGMTATVVRDPDAGPLENRFLIVRQRPSANPALAEEFRRQRAVAASYPP